MNFDLNAANFQSTSIHLIPSLSKVFVKLSIIYPSAQNIGSAKELTKRSSGIEQLCVKLKVVRGTYKNTYFFHNFNISNPITPGHQKAIEISKSHLRALVEANWSISPKDFSENAKFARKLHSFSDINTYIFPITVDTEINDKGFLSNKLKSIITIDDPDYKKLLEYGEIIK